MWKDKQRGGGRGRKVSEGMFLLFIREFMKLQKVCYTIYIVITTSNNSVKDTNWIKWTAILFKHGCLFCLVLQNTGRNYQGINSEINRWTAHAMMVHIDCSLQTPSASYTTTREAHAIYSKAVSKNEKDRLVWLCFYSGTESVINGEGTTSGYISTSSSRMSLGNRLSTSWSIHCGLQWLFLLTKPLTLWIWDRKVHQAEAEYRKRI